MSTAVVILGAGSSADFGVPTLANIFKDRQARRFLADNPDLHELLQEHFWGPRGYDIESSNESLTIEEMLTALRDWEREEGVPEPPDVNHFRKKLFSLLQRAVYESKLPTGGILTR